ncbi:hypothetical protein BDW69DRAFT_188630 [Aspergillus filifer]
MTDSNSSSDPPTDTSQLSQSPPSDSKRKREADSPQPESSPPIKRARVDKDVEGIFTLLVEAESKLKAVLKRAQDAIEQVESFLHPAEKQNRKCAQIILTLMESVDPQTNLVAVSSKDLDELPASSFTALILFGHMSDRCKEAKNALAQI